MLASRSPIGGPAAYAKRRALRARSARRIGREQVPMEFGQPDITRVHRTPEESEVLIGALGPIFEEDVPVITDTSAENFFAAVEKRVNYYDSGHARETYSASQDLLNKKIPERQPEIDWTYELFEEWNSHNDAGKQKRMIAALDEFPAFTDRKYGAKDIFTKVELLLKSHDPDWAGRLVNNSTDLHNAISGPILQACTKRLNYILDNNQEGEQQYVLGYGTATIDKVASRINTLGKKAEHVVECDFSANDMMQCAEAQLCEAEWLLRLGAPKWLTDIMVKANVYKVYNRDFQFQATISFQLPSGSTSTTFRNCIWNMSIFHLWVLSKYPGSSTVRSFLAFFLGDDMLAIITSSDYPVTRGGRSDLARSYEYATKISRMKGKVKVHESLVDAEFLSKHFVPATCGWRMFPKIGRALSKLNIRVNNNPNLSNEEYMLGKLLSYSFEYRYLPIIRDRLLERAFMLEADFGLNIMDLSTAAFSYNYYQVVRELGQLAAMRLINVDDADEIDEDSLGQWISYRYSLSLTEFEEFLDALIFGDEDIPRLQYEPFAARDFRS